MQYFKVYFFPPTIFFIFPILNKYFERGVPLCLPGSAEAASVKLIIEIIEVVHAKKIIKLYIYFRFDFEMFGFPFAEDKHIVINIVKTIKNDKVIK